MMNLKPFPLKTLLSSSSSIPSPLQYSLSVFISHFSTSSQTTTHFPSRRHEEEARQVKVSVWWDFENCNLPAGTNVFKIAHMITAAVRANGIKGPIHITAFGDILQLTRAKQEALSSTGVYLAHIPSGGKNSADRSLLVDLMYWVSQNPPPAHLFLISGDRDFASVLHRLRMNNYNVLLATLGSAPSVLCSAASIVWNWVDLLKGKNLTGKHYNQPPDGPYGSWYGHYKVPLEDPFSVVEQPAACPRPEDSSDSCSDTKIRSVPRAVVRQIRQILNSYPNGISICDLRLELEKNDIILDKSYYGYKKLSSFLFSMPNILSLQDVGDGQFIARRTTTKAIEPSETSPCESADPDFRDGENLNVSSRSSGDDSLVGDGKPTSHRSPEVNAKVTTTRKVQQSPPENNNVVEVTADKPPEEVLQTIPVDQKNAEASNEQVNEGHQTAPVLETNSASEVGFIRQFWQRWFGGVDVNSEIQSHNLPEKHGDSEGRSAERNNNTLQEGTGVSSEGEGKKEDCDAKSCKVADEVTYSPSSNDSSFDNKVSAETGESHTGKRLGLFNQIANWFRAWRTSQEPTESSDQSCEKLDKIKVNSLNHEVFTQDSFWKDMAILMDSSRGSVLVTQSRTREEMAQNLLKEGPLVLRSLSNTDLLQLVDLLISDKQWIEECPSQTPTFRITKSVEKSPVLLHSHAANGLRSIFMRTSSHANLQPKHEGEKKSQNIPHAGVSSTILSKNSLDRSRSEVIADCQKLVKLILKENPEGYNISDFRRLFLQRYGYPLDIQRLGYKKLASLLEMMPGIKIESNYIMPDRLVPDNSSPETSVPKIHENTTYVLGNSAGQLSDASTKGDDFESTWDELGPVSGTSSNKRELQSVSGSKRAVKMKAAYSNYEPSVSDDEFSDSDGEISTSKQPGKQQKKPVINEEDSSLLQILDSWYSSKEDGERRGNSAKSEDMIDCSEYQVKPSAASGVGMKIETSSEDCGKRQRAQKSYSFVADPVGNDKDKLINGILGSLKKTSESRMQA